MKSINFNTRIYLLGHEWLANVTASGVYDSLDIDSIVLKGVFKELQDDLSNVVQPLAFDIPVEPFQLPNRVLRGLEGRAASELLRAA